jgi:hypothetical protein
VLPARAVFSHSDRRTSSGCAACAMAGTITGPVCEPQGRYAVEFHDSRDLRGASGNPWSHSWSEVGSSRVARELLSLPVASQGRLLAANLDQVREVLITGAIAVFLWTTSAYVHSPCATLVIQPHRATRPSKRTGWLFWPIKIVGCISTSHGLICGLTRVGQRHPQRAAEPRLRREQTQPNGSEPPAPELESA